MQSGRKKVHIVLQWGIFFLNTLPQETSSFMLTEWMKTVKDNGKEKLYNLNYTNLIFSEKNKDIHTRCKLLS